MNDFLRPLDRTGATVLHVDPDADYRARIDSALDAVSITTVQAASTADGMERLPAVDCVVSDHDPPSVDGFEFLSAVRERDPTLPFVLHTSTGLGTVAARLLRAEATDYVFKGQESSIDLLARRIRVLVERSRLAGTVRRLAAAVDVCREPTLVVDGDGTVEHANAQLVSTVRPANDDLRGRPWTDLFTDEAIARLQRAAIPVGMEGWAWTGPTTLSDGDGSPIDARTDLVQIEDGSKIFVFREIDAGVGEPA